MLSLKEISLRGSLRNFLISILPLLACAALAAQSSGSRSVITVHVGKTGMFSGFGHEHTVIAPISSGRVDSRALTVQITVLAKQMKVTDSEVSAKDQAEVQSIMLGPKVLDVDRYPEIRFQSSRVQPTRGQNYRVTGTLDLHGVSRELSFDVTGTPDHYHGKARFKQTDFNITPVAGGGGTVKVKDELELEFDVYPADFVATSH